jgi:hypothetical protein
VSPVRLVLGIFVLPALLVAGTLAWVSSVRPRIAEPMAIHWNASGQVNGTSTVGSFLVIPLTMTLVFWGIGALMLLAGRTSRVRFRYQRWAMVSCCGVTSFFMGLLVLTVQANLDTTAAAASLPPVTILGVLGLAVIGGLIGWALAGRPPELPPEVGPSPSTLATVPARSLGPGEHPVWERHQASWLLIALTASMIVVGLVLIPILLVAGVIVLVSAVCCLPLASLAAIVDEQGLLVRFGPFGFPQKRIPLATIASVRADTIEPLEWGGWGYRIAPGRSAAVLRSGPGIVVELTDGRRFAVTVDDPEGGVALLQAYLDRAAVH